MVHNPIPRKPNLRQMGMYWGKGYVILSKRAKHEIASVRKNVISF